MKIYIERLRNPTLKIHLMRILQAVVGIVDNLTQLLTLGFYTTAMEVQVSQEILAEACRNRDKGKGPLVKTIYSVNLGIIKVIFTLILALACYTLPMYLFSQHLHPSIKQGFFFATIPGTIIIFIALLYLQSMWARIFQSVCIAIILSMFSIWVRTF